MNYYELYEIPVSPKVDSAIISKKYFALQRSSHPDFHTHSMEVEQEEKLELSAQINKAFTIFKDPQKTIEYYLEYKKAILPDEKYNLSTDFLMEMMDLNEALESNNHMAVESEVGAIDEKLHLQINKILEKKDMDISENDLMGLKDYYYKKKYLQRILERLDD